MIHRFVSSMSQENKKVFLSFLLPLLFNCFVFFFLQLLFTNYPLIHHLGRFSVNIDNTDKLFMFLQVSFFILICLVLLYSANLIFLFKDSEGKSNYPFSLSFLKFSLMSILASLSSIIDNIFELPIIIHNLVHIFSFFSLVMFSYCLINLGSISKKMKVFAFSLITLNFFTFVIIPIILGFLSKLFLFISSLIFTSFFIERKKSFTMFLFAITFILCIIPFQSYKSFYRDFFFDGSFKPVSIKNLSFIPKYFNSDCDISSYSSVIPKPAKLDFINNISDKSMQRINSIESGFLHSDFEQLNQLILNAYFLDNSHVFSKNFPSIYKEMIHSGNYVVPMSINRMFGTNNIPQDGSRAARLLILNKESSSAIAKGLFGLLLIQGNGIPPDKYQGVHCLLVSKNTEVINYFYMHASNEEKAIFNLELFNDPSHNNTDEIKYLIERQRLEHKANLIKHLAIPSNLSDYFNELMLRLDQSKNLILINKILVNDHIGFIGLSAYSSIFYSFIPRILWLQKPIISDTVGVNIGVILGLFDQRNPLQSWALPVMHESLLVAGLWGFFITSFSTALLFSIYYYQAQKSNLHLILYGNFAAINMTMYFFTGFINFLSGMIQSFIFLVVFITFLNLPLSNRSLK